jgi:hypothetical protein
VLAKAATAHPHPSATMIVLTGLLAAFLVLVVWPVVTHSMTLAHEGAHALVASLFGKGIEHIKVHRDGGGATRPKSGAGGMALFGIGLVGYLGPSLFGLLGALLLRAGQPVVVLWISLVFLAIMLLQLANMFGRLAVLLTGAVIFLFARYGSTGAQTVFAFTWIWLLLIGGFRDAIGLSQVRRKIREAKKKDDSSDAFQLRKLTYVPATLWVGFFFLATLAALVLGGTILING